MADFEVTDPTGKKFVITAPEGATQEQVLSYAQSQFKQPAAAPQQPRPDPGLYTPSGEQPTLPRQILETAGKLTPLGAASAINKASGEAISKAAYKTGGAVTDITGSPEAGAVANIGIEAIPMAIGGGTGKVLTQGLERLGARKLMQSILKPQYTSLEKGDADKAITTILEKGITPSREGLADVQGQVSKLNDEIAAIIKNSGATIDKKQVASRLRSVADRFENQVNPVADREAVAKVYDEFLSQFPDRIAIQQAQRLKQGTYARLGERAFGELGSAEQEAQKGLARGLKEDIATKEPSVAAKNKEESELLNVIAVAERRALLDGNKNPAGLSLLAKNPEAFAAFMADRSPWFKNAIARLMYRGGMGQTAGQLLGGAQGAYSGMAPREKQ